MDQHSRPSSPEQTHNYTALPPSWQKCSRSPRANDANKSKERKIETSKTNSNEQPSIQINTHNRFAVLESSNDAMEIADPPSNHPAQRTPPPTYPTNICCWCHRHPNNDQVLRERYLQGGLQLEDNQQQSQNPANEPRCLQEDYQDT